MTQPQQSGKPRHQRQAETEPLGRATGLAAHAIEFLENELLLRLRNARPPIGDDDREFLSATPDAEQDSTARRIFCSVGEQVLNDVRQDAGVGFDPEPRRDQPQAAALLFDNRGILDCKLVEQRSQIEDLGPRHYPT